MVGLWRLTNSALPKLHSALTNTKELDSVICALASFKFGPHLIQTRDFRSPKRRKTHPFYWLPKRRRERNDQGLTSDNQGFINQAIFDKYGPAYVPDSPGMPYVSPLKEEVRLRSEWTPQSVRTGVIARKIGVYPMWDKDGKRFLSTLLQVVDNHVIKYISPEEVQRNYGKTLGPFGLLIVGAESADPQIFTKEFCNLFNECGTLPKVKLNRFTITPDAVISPGTPLYATHFQPGQYVDISGFTIDRGFQGVMKRWDFRGLRATHGVTKSHRRGGNTGGGGEKGRIWPGTKLPGHMGRLKRTLTGVQILRINTKYNVIYVKGPNIAGETNNFVTIRDTFLRTRKFDVPPPFPTHYPDEVSEPLPDDIFEPMFHNYSDPTILFEDKR